MKKYFGTIELDGEWESWIEIVAVTRRQAAQRTLMHFYDKGLIALGEPTKIRVSIDDAIRPIWNTFKGKVMTEVELLD